MTQPNDSILVTPGTGATVATHTVGGKEYQVVMIADASGHIQQSLPTYILYYSAAVVGANKLYGDLFNAAGSGRIIDIRGVWYLPKTDVGITGTVSVEMGLYRTSAVGTGGSAVAYNSGSAMTTSFMVPKDTTNAALPAQITARAVPTGGATISAPWVPAFVRTEETADAPPVSSLINVLPAGNYTQRFVLNEGQGILFKQGSVAGAGSLGILVEFTVE